jgi:hypothetical protein
MAMHVEVPKGKLSTFKEFTGEYLMIVVSIITALALEHTVQTYHHRHLAREASAKIDAELRQDLRELVGSLAHNRAEAGKVLKLRDMFVEALKQGLSDEKAIAMLRAESKHPLDISINSPTLRREAWDVAVANQSASWMEPEQLEHYAAIYAQMRDVDAIANGGSNKFFDGPQLVNVVSDMQVGRGRAQDVLRALNQILFSYGAINGNLKGLEKSFAQELKLDSTTIARK